MSLRCPENKEVFLTSDRISTQNGLQLRNSDSPLLPREVADKRVEAHAKEIKWK